MLVAPDIRGPDPGCSKLPLPALQPGEEEEGGIREGVGVGMRVHTEVTGESMGGVGEVVGGGRGPGASRAAFNCDRGCGSSTKEKRQETFKKVQGRENQTAFVFQNKRAR